MDGENGNVTGNEEEEEENDQSIEEILSIIDEARKPGEGLKEVGSLLRGGSMDLDDIDTDADTDDIETNGDFVCPLQVWDFFFFLKSTSVRLRIINHVTLQTNLIEISKKKKKLFEDKGILLMAKRNLFSGNDVAFSLASKPDLCKSYVSFQSL